MATEIIWFIGSVILMLIGIVHLLGTILTNLLHPKSKHLMEKMKATNIEVDSKISIWNAWIIFNIGFSVFLFLVGFINFFLAYYHFEIVKGFSIYSMSMLLGSGTMVYFGHKYSVKKIRTVFLLIFIFYFISVILSL